MKVTKLALFNLSAFILYGTDKHVLQCNVLYKISIAKTALQLFLDLLKIEDFGKDYRGLM